jgi:Na+/melibiose symporter-like transporter
MANRQLRRLLAAALATSAGEFGVFVALSVYAYQEGGAALVGLVAAVQTVPAVLAASAATLLLSDRLSRRRLLLVTNVLRAILVAAIALAVAADVAVWLVIVLAGAHGVVSTANQPARAALMTILARTPGELAAANPLLSSINNMGFMIGCGLGGLLVAAADPQTGFWLCALAYLVGAGIVASLPAPAREHARGAVAVARGEATAALRTVYGNPQLRAVFVLIAALSMADGLLAVLVVVAPIQVLGLGTSGIGYLNIACGVGGLATGALAPALLRRGGLAGTLLVGCLVLGVPVAAVSLAPHAAVAIVAWGCVGLGFSLVKSSGLTLVLRLSTAREMLRVLGALETTLIGFAGLGSIAAPLLIALAGVEATLAAAGLLLPIVGLVRWRALGRFEAEAPTPGPEFELLRTNTIFAPLPLATIELLARRLRWIDAAPGATIIEQGAAGEDWYLVAAGELVVSEDDTPRRRLAAGDGFGEIALLRDVPRTATVRASAPSRLLALDRGSFLSAVRGVPDSHEAARAVAKGYRARPESGREAPDTGR